MHMAVNELICLIIARCSVRKTSFELGSIYKRVDIEHNFKIRFINELNLSTSEFDSIVRKHVCEQKFMRHVRERFASRS